MSDPISSRPRRTTGSYLRVGLAVLPFLGMLVAIPAVNRVRPIVLGLPFLLFWVVAWVVLTSVIMAIIFFTDPINKRGGGSTTERPATERQGAEQ